MLNIFKKRGPDNKEEVTRHSVRVSLSVDPHLAEPLWTRVALIAAWTWMLANQSVRVIL